MFYQNHCSMCRVIKVTGSGQVAAKPDMVQFQIEVVTTGQDVSEAQEQNAVTMNQVIQSIVELTIPRESIQTAAYTISPRYDYIEGRQVFRGYEVSNAITVKLTDLTQVGTVIDTAVQNGATHISSIQFTISNEDIYYQQALKVALQNAKLKAKTIAEKMKLSLYPQPIEIVEISNSRPAPYQAAYNMNEASSTPIEPGQLTISATVNVKFRF
ncbi:SIMPL domain-containing protein [Lysinibacillus sp. 54212]|uniref:SIMPL domain-containing protein n=1 Tax=Lysinibacillus sp. 54212 TaxID=3119829 RepID=UPI002FC7890D